jgi:sucrose-phosphate synthase
MHIIFLNPQGNFDPHDLYWTEHPDFGGQLVYVKEVCMALAQMDVKVDIVTRRIDDPDWPGFAGKIDSYPGYEANLRIVRIECGGLQFLNKERLWPHLDEFTTNLVAFYGDTLPDFATGHYGDGGYSGVLLKHKAGLGFTFTGHSLGAQKLEKLGMTLTNFDQMEQQYHFSQRIRGERLSMEHAFRIITSTSQERMEQYSHPLYQGAVDVLDDAKFAVIPPGVNTRIFTTQPGADDASVHRQIEAKLGGDTRPCVVVSSRLDEKKNHLGAVKAYALSQELRDKTNLGLFIRGIDDPFAQIDQLTPKEQQILRPVLDMILQHNLRDRVFFLNIKSQRELAAAYRYFAGLGSVFALTAFYEPFGLAPIEAAACGLAVVTTQNGGPSEIFEDGSGILVDPFDEHKIAAGFLRGIRDAAHYAKLGERRVQTKYTWKKTADAYLAVIREGAGQPYPQDFTLPETDAAERIKTYLNNRCRSGA